MLELQRAVVDSGHVDREHEERAVADVVSRLRGRFPDVDPTIVEAAVSISYGRLTGPIRDFVPLLVEHAARDRLAFLGADDEPLSA